MPDVTQILTAIEDGDPSAAERLLPLIYDELRKLAAARMAQESPDHTLAATALVHEAYIRLVDVDQAQSWDNRGHFFAAAAEAMRRVLVEIARKKGRQKRGGQRKKGSLHEADVTVEPIADELLDLAEALTELADHDPRSAELAKLRLLAGMTLDEAAGALDISPRTATRDWSYAQAWLSRVLRAHDDNGE
ncbi:MAG: sigma-70 family RNA polymerase sigma factor [Planctomycetaceae bacterium]|nr:sigma-70 family RNA polymerase sigma factor [Planctomycetaceae bacterium]MBT6153098.1 sigma-70 family RNA polymerase sigma factor [Planctomycetaceae bacterium]MBT6484893.1 sigma-70 family RNA polymerase sigma factor [Planctomycetaceae bacterium]MBT6495212.1 sigma-70 family RNA polymerase sigma factor [Planctomycetaceae bacterium]